MKPNAIYICGGGGTAVINGSASGLFDHALKEYRSCISSFFAAVGGMRGALNEDITDVFSHDFNHIKQYSAPAFGTSRHVPDAQDCSRLIDVFVAHNIQYVFLNGGNDTMEKAIILRQFSQEKGIPLYIVGIPKTIDNDLLVTHRCPGYATFAKYLALKVIGMQQDLYSFRTNTTNCSVKEGGVAQILVSMGRDCGWGAAASVLVNDECLGPHVVLTPEGGFCEQAFLDKCQNAFDMQKTLFVVASEGVKDEEYLANNLEVYLKNGLRWKYHKDAHKNNSVTDSRLGLYLKLLLENKLRIPANIFKDFKVRESGPCYSERNHPLILSQYDFQDAVAVGRTAADVAFSGIGGVMIILVSGVGNTSYTALESVANLGAGSKRMVKNLSCLKNVLSSDGLMVNAKVMNDYVGSIVDIHGPNRDFLCTGLPLSRVTWHLVEKKLSIYNKV
ncbi:6-phosphofructokinase [Candidatus Woesearchaeota archaeon]|nr:6-phosphofructokinase [Candidatus Woesearchaeota archaeon]